MIYINLIQKENFKYYFKKNKIGGKIKKIEILTKLLISKS